MSASTCARISPIPYPTTASWSVRLRWGFTCCCSSRPAPWARARAYPSSTPRPWVSCHIKREKQHKTMKGWAAKGKCTMGWFYGFKLHLVINDKGEIIQWQLTPGNVDDREPLKNRAFIERLFGKLFADRGYISQNLFEMLFVDDIHLVTKLKRNMKNSLMNLYDKILLRKRAVIETVNDELKNICQIEHTRHRSVDNFATNLFAGLIAYNLLPKKPSMNIEIIDKSKLIA